jgi:hypothetical protein
MSVNRVTARRWQRRRHFDPLAGVQHLAQLDVDAGKLHGRRFRGMECGGHAAECRQYLRRVIHQVAQLALVHGICPSAQPQLVELHIAAGPGEFDRVQFSVERDL